MEKIDRLGWAVKLSLRVGGNDWGIRFIATHRVGSQAMKVLVFARCTVVFATHLVRSRPSLAHLHTVGKTGSFSRNTILAAMSRLAGVPVILHVHSSAIASFYNNSPRQVRWVIRATFDRVDAVAVLDETSAVQVRAVAPNTWVAVVPEVTQLDALYRDVCR